MEKLGSTAAGDGVAVGLFYHVDADNTLDFFKDSYRRQCLRSVGMPFFLRSSQFHLPTFSGLRLSFLPIRYLSSSSQIVFFLNSFLSSDSCSGVRRARGLMYRCWVSSHFFCFFKSRLLNDEVLLLFLWSKGISFSLD